jgi:uncharacterized protein (DUF433 family)
MTLPDFLRQGDLGEIRFVGSRIDLHFVIERYNQGWSPEMIALEFDTVSLANVHKAVAFYLENTAAVDAYLRETDRLYEEALAKYPRVDLDKLRARLAARQKEQAAKAEG